MAEKEYLILTTRHRDQLFGGDVHLFWGSNHSGYTAVLQRAGLYTREEAYKIGDDDDIPIHYTEFKMHKDFFQSLTNQDFAQYPSLYSKSDHTKNLIADWQFKLRHKEVKE